MKKFEKYIDSIVDLLYKEKYLEEEFDFKTKNSLKFFLLLEEEKRERHIIDYFRFTMAGISDMPEWFNKKIEITNNRGCVIDIKPRNFEDFQYQEVGYYSFQLKIPTTVGEGDYVILYDDLKIEISKDLPVLEKNG